VLLKLNQSKEVMLKLIIIFIKAEEYCPIYIKHTLETPKVVLLGLLLAERVWYNTHTWQDHYVLMKMRNNTAMPGSTSIRIFYVSSRKKMKSKSLEVIIYFIILLGIPHKHTSLNPKIQKIFMLIIQRK
jgi:hypothetical protein